MDKITIQHTEHFDLIKINVEKLDGTLSPDLKSMMVERTEAGSKNVILNLTDTRYCDSSGLSAILVGNRLCKNNNGVLVLFGLQPMVEKLISISQLTNILNIVPTEQEAKDIVAMESMTKDIENEA